MKSLVRLSVVLTVFSLATATVGQEVETEKKGTTVQLPVFAKATISTTVSVPDGGVVLMAGRRISTNPKSSREIIAGRKLNNRICTKTKSQDKTVYDILHNNKPLGLVVYDDGRIEMTITRIFTGDDVTLLNKHHPDVLMHVTAFPKTSNEDSPIRLKLEIDSTYEFEDVSELEASDPELHAIFCQYVQPKPPVMMVTPRLIIQEEPPIITQDEKKEDK